MIDIEELKATLKKVYGRADCYNEMLTQIAIAEELKRIADVMEEELEANKTEAQFKASRNNPMAAQQRDDESPSLF